jgi:SAM-dependent methyltransferase
LGSDVRVAGVNVLSPSAIGSQFAGKDPRKGIAYSDGDEVERRLLEVVNRAHDCGTFSVELARAITDWPSEYHLSRERHCVVRPLGIRPGDEVLELGCGCGAITRFLGELGANVTAVEGSVQRASIAAGRCRDLPNVKVIADDLLCLDSDRKFDWVLLIGVLEYAPVFSSEPDPVGHYLRSVSRFLAPRGRLVVAIENKLGLKYFNACSEDHLGVPFAGIQGLYGERTPRTFGRGELEAVLKAAGLEHVEFLYPLPDYKLPRVILSDAALSDPLFNAADLLALAQARDYGGSPYRLFDETLVWREAARNRLIGPLSNSFLAVGTKHPREHCPDDPLAVVYSAQRVAAFATQTSFVRVGGAIEVVKDMLCPGLSRRHAFRDGSVLENLADKSDYFRGELCIWKLWAARANWKLWAAKANPGDIDQIVTALETWFDFLLRNAKPSPEAAALGRPNLSQFVLISSI